MIPRTLLRQFRALSSSIRPTPRAPSAATPFRASRLAFPTSRIVASPRWYSSETTSEKKADDAAEKKSEPKTAEAEDPAKKELEAKNKEIVDLKDKYLRQVAEFRNLQERTKRDMESAKSFAIQKFAKDLVDSVDNLDRALSTVPPEKLVPSETNGDLVALYEGLKMTDNILMSTLKKHGLERFDPSVEGEKFNPNEHEATFMTPMQGKEDNTVFHTQQKGFKLNGRVLRAAKVGVVKNS